ncbi:T7SS effector LXG polymorphic toxin [Bacillus mycoides]|uniref:AHH domain-containing protein n=1 Tax=Bacillus TaxID=1386 RepID=UPI000DC2856A|nr:MULTISPECIES: T7SS effector LXG polymorphic toxin [Bacillus]MED1013140.1 T7SS effector LXG polymorphic toxin [Bacillus mycoides]MED1048058.1 T7SS effector LXG polymorphic toxin [Bacillus mycoides]MED1048916.1 T7SS effector LXG polymorphic toxin [Bacillus mycoides]RAN74370.1 hypothetical protein B5P42_27620 [Bacillus sp. SRB_331]
MGFQVDLKEFLEVLAKLQKDTGKTNEKLEKAKNALNGIIQADAMQGATGKAIVDDINNNQNTVVTGLELANKSLIMEMVQTLQDFQSTTGETDENAVILEDALLQAQNKLSNLQPKKHEMDSRISNIYNSVSDLISLSMPNSQFDEKLVAASKELEDTIQKVQQFESKKEKSNAEEILNTLNKQVQMAKEVSSLSYTNPQLQAFFAQDALAKGIHEMDTQITKAEKEAELQAEREMKKKQEEWAEHHPVEAWLQNFSKSAGEKWDVLRKGTEWVGENIPFLKGLADDALVLEGFLGAAGSAISGIAIGAMKVTYLALELGEWGFNSIRGVETEQWKLDDIYGAGNTIKNLGQAIISWQDYPKYGKALVNSVKGYVEKALTDPYALGGAIFDIGSCFIGVGEVTAAVKGGKLAQGAKVFQVAEKSGKIGGKLEEIMAFTNKLPSSMKNVVEKIKNIEIPNLFRETAAAGVGSVEERKTLGELFSVAKSETKGTGDGSRLIPGTPGKVTGGSSSKLGKNMFEEMGLRRSTKRSPYQAQHIIPAEFNGHPVIEKIGMDMDHASNGFFLRVPDEYVSSTSRHQGYHSVYSDFVERKLDGIDINQDISIIEKQVFELQQKLRKLQEKGLPLYMTNDYLQKELKILKQKGLDDYLLDRANNKDRIRPVWGRGGGATIDLWERWFNKI